MRDYLKKVLVFLLTLEAKLVIRRYKPRVIAVTGSVGKTSTKDAIYAMVAGNGFVRKSEKSFNSEFGIPLTILGCPNAWNNPLRWIQNLLDGLFLIVAPTRYPDWLVLEVGADRPGDIKSVAQWLPVDVVVITRLPEMLAHVEFFPSPQAVIDEKAALIGALKPNGTLILFEDEVHTRALASRLPKGPEAQARTLITFGLAKEADVRGEEITAIVNEKTGQPTGMSAVIQIGGESVAVEVIGAIGGHALVPALAAAAVGKALGKSASEIKVALKMYEPPHGRMHLIPGQKETMIIDDTYNSSPAAAIAALDAMVFAAPNTRKIAVLGDMLELGKHSAQEHRKVGAHAARMVDLLATVGFRAQDIADGALDAGLAEGKILQYENASQAALELEKLLQPGDCILVKGSQGMRMERVVEMLMADPEKAPELLVRQDAEWKKR